MQPRIVATLAVGAFAASAVLGWSWHHASASRSADHAIAPDPDTHAALPVTPEVPADPGIASPRMNDSSPRPRGLVRPRAPTTLQVDTIEPWTGEDLAPQLQLAAAVRARLQFDRHDPWNPATTHPVMPARDLILDSDDPWAVNATSNGVANASPPEPSSTDTRL